MNNSKTAVKAYDVVILGAGPAGNRVATLCAAAGKRVAIAEALQLGGTCPLRGCNPKKVLVGAAEAIARSAALDGRGIEHGGRINWPQLMRFKNDFVEPIPDEIENVFLERGIDVFEGKARFAGRTKVEVGEHILFGDKIVIAVGAEPQELPIPGVEKLLLSDQFLDLEELPESVVFVGGGYISFEFAHIAARAGARATIIEALDQVLSGFDQDIVEHLLEATRALGIEVHTHMPVQSIDGENGEIVVRAGYKGEREFPAKIAVHGAGRVPAIADLRLELADVAYGRNGVQVNDYLQSVSNPHVYAAGDAADTPFMLTPTADREAEAAARNIIAGENLVKPDLPVVPSCVFTIPPLATVGAAEEQLKQAGVDYDKVFKNTARWFTSEAIGLEHSAIKLLIAKESRKILGAHILGHHAEEMINVFALAMRFGLTAGDLKKMIWAYPSAVYDIKHLV